MSGTSKPDARWAGEKLTGHEQAEDFCIPSFSPSPKTRCQTSRSLTQVGAGRRDLAVPTEGQEPFSQWLYWAGRRWADSLSPSPSSCFGCCLFHCRNIKIPLQPQKKKIYIKTFSRSHASVSVDIKQQVWMIYVDLYATMIDVLMRLR